MIDSRLVEAFLAVTDLGSFELAALKLNLTQPAISQRIKALERLLGHVLLERTRPVLPTATGQQLVGYLQRSVLLQEEALRELAPEPGRTSRITLGVNLDSLATWFPQALAQALKGEDYLIHLRLDDKSHTHHLLEKGDVMGCVSSNPTNLKGVRTTPIGEMEYVCVATAEFARQHFPEGVTREALLHAPALTGGEIDDLHHLFIEESGIYRSQYPRWSVPSSNGIFDLCCLGLGYAWVPAVQAAARLADGHLQLLLEETRKAPLYWLSWEVMPDGVAALFKRLILEGRRLIA
ncbi:ArgP/LysG family DNA-binding transcriptional regulator [Pseudomonas sp. CAN2814]|uniref:ArgP/LysG family DNA-binding transcriptional regulator n=1 Tax=Pseudomonas sp. CAN1 TaxID=3046726 RepID=UPI002649921A|nr:ArgP/LysG family DNA-binding transcriptional regulator [Pseudomonas sp. CAN1]MDN6859243.1 ArgP/LysG family DNA-binding transcriptional regulator [Pseudomonas sp. CAN1]